MKKIVLFLLLVILSKQILFAEQGPISQTNDELRYIFGQLSYSTNFLYDMAAHTVEEGYFSTNCSMPTNYSIWYRTYQEMYNCAKNQNLMLSPSQVVDIAHSYESDTVVIGIMDYKYNKLSSSYSNYFILDSNHQRFLNNYSNPYYENAFIENEIFMVAPTIKASHGLNPIFCLKDIIFFDYIAYDQFYSDNYHLKIDFGDGLGFHVINLQNNNSPIYIQAEYLEKGEYTMTTLACKVVSGDTICEKQSISKIYISDEASEDSMIHYNVSWEKNLLGLI